MASLEKSRCNTPFGALGRRKRRTHPNETVFYKFIENTNSCEPFYAKALPPFYGFKTEAACDAVCRNICE